MVEEIREGIQHLIELSYETGYISAKMEAFPSDITDDDRKTQKQLIDSCNRVKIMLFGLIDDYINTRILMK